MINEASSTINSAESDFIAKARLVGETVLAPHAQETDTGSAPRRENFRALAEAGLFGMAIPKAFGGLDVSPQAQRDVAELLASYCGVTTFTQAQHHGPSRMIANCPNSSLKEALLPKLATGEWITGVSFAHLRRPGAPILSAEPVKGGYLLQGTAPWVTGWGVMNQFVFGATLPDGRFVYLWSPANHADFPELFADTTPPSGDWGAMSVSPPIPLCGMNASATVILTFENWFIPQEHWMLESDRETMRRNDRSNVLGATAMPLGCSAGSVRVLCDTAEKRGMPAIRRAANSFTREWEALKSEVLEWLNRQEDPNFTVEALRIRAWCLDLGVRAAHAAITANSGSANMLTHPAQRLLREALFYTIQAQTQEVMDATLARLER